MTTKKKGNPVEKYVKNARRGTQKESMRYFRPIDWCSGFDRLIRQWFNGIGDGMTVERYNNTMEINPYDISYFHFISPRVVSIQRIYAFIFSRKKYIFSKIFSRLPRETFFFGIRFWIRSQQPKISWCVNFQPKMMLFSSGMG